MKILFIADARSPIALGWIDYFIKRGFDVHIISTYPCDVDRWAGATVYQLPIAFSGLLGAGVTAQNGASPRRSYLKRRLAGLRQGKLARWTLAARMWTGPIALQRQVRRARELVWQ